MEIMGRDFFLICIVFFSLTALGRGCSTRGLPCGMPDLSVAARGLLVVVGELLSLVAPCQLLSSCGIGAQ